MLTIKAQNGKRYPLQVEDCWHAAMNLTGTQKALVLRTWHIAHAMRHELEHMHSGEKSTLIELTGNDRCCSVCMVVMTKEDHSDSNICRICDDTLDAGYDPLEDVSGDIRTL